MPLTTVIFDLGGVVLGSPLRAIRQYEQDQELPVGAVGRHINASGSAGAWSRLECGELDLRAFCEAFDEECRAASLPITGRELMRRIGRVTKPRPEMLEAIARLRQAELRVAALTNNWHGEGDGTRVLAPHFDAFFESAVLGLRKPDPRIYHHVCQELGIEAEQAVFLDDIGSNLKTARKLGMTTIKVDEPRDALSELSALLGIDLT